MASSTLNLDVPAARAGLVVVAAAGLVGGIYFYFLRSDTQASLAILGGTAAVFILLMLYGIIVRWARRRRGKPLERAIVRNTASLPYGVSEPATRAAIDDLRRKFEAGLTKFRAAGKDLYSLPWYAIVGEPGSGKTEAIRRCNVGFPPGLQDGAQGAGGTLNMNWWFTNHAVLLDTAGRLVFHDRSPGRGNEWDEFLSLLAKSRPNCPINGLMLVLPADSLITDTADQIEPKAANIAKQLDHIQRSLGVRFPVFVIVTKCDLINGFREFFEDLNDPQLQHQMLGWSNPEPRDEPFRPELLEQHLLAIRGRLLRRRQQLLADPVHTQDPGGKRIEQVDALYTLPDAMLRIGPRLRRYLEMIFMPGEWSPRPLFLRGIYFTSSVRDGSALDAELADAMKLPVAALDADSRSWERERAYFLRDLFMHKVFREKGLVTRAADTRKLQRRRKLLLAATATVAVIALLYFSWTGAKSLNESIGGQTRYWRAIDKSWRNHRSDWNLVQPAAAGAWQYNGCRDIYLADTRTTLGEFFAEVTSQTDRPVVVPWIFRAQQAVRGDLNERRRLACRELLETCVFAPSLDAAREKLRTLRPETWTPAAAESVSELLRLETLQAGLAPTVAGENTGGQKVRLDPLLQLVVSDDDYHRYKSENRESLREAMDRIYVKWAGTGHEEWPPASLAAGADSSRAAVDAGVKAMEKFYLSRLQGRSQRLAELKLVLTAVDRFQRAEETFLRSAAAFSGASASPEAFIRLRPEWLVQLRDIETARQMLEENMARLERDQPMEKPLLALYEVEIDRDIESAMRAHEHLANQIPKASATDAAPAVAPLIRHLQSVQQTLHETSERFPSLRAEVLPDDLRNDLSRADRVYLALSRGLDGREHRSYLVLGEVYARIGAQLAAIDSNENAAGTDSSVVARRIEAETAEVVRQLDAVASVASVERIRQVVGKAKILSEGAASVRKDRLKAAP